MCLIYKTLAKYIFNINLTFRNFFNLVTMLHMGIKKSAKSGFWIYDLGFWIYDLRFTKTEC